VRRERDEELDVLRFRRPPTAAAIPQWSVRVFCDRGHENVFSGTDDS
jgi:hypothetical protein